MTEEPWTEVQRNLARSVLRLFPDVDVQRLVRCVDDLVHDPDEVIALLTDVVDEWREDGTKPTRINFAEMQLAAFKMRLEVREFFRDARKERMALLRPGVGSLPEHSRDQYGR
jgi:hypothetical protein